MAMPPRPLISRVTMTAVNDRRRILRATEMGHDAFLHHMEGVMPDPK